MLSYEVAERIFLENSLEYNEKLHQKLEIYCDFLIEYNKNVNLTAITEHNEVWLKHFADSILILKYANISENSTLIDVGTGAGFPSVPLKLFREDLKITLLDSLNKRILFLEKLCEKLEIDAEFVHGRAEEFARKDEYREKFDVSTARAVASMPVLCEYCLPFVKKDGMFIALKGPNEDINIAQNAIKILGGNVTEDSSYTLGKDDKRKIFVVKKISQTPTKYPRNSGQIKNKPL